MASCKSCGREIVWAKSPTGANIPLSHVNIVYTLDDQTGDATPIQSGAYFISHFVDCPHAASHSKGKKP